MVETETGGRRPVGVTLRVFLLTFGFAFFLVGTSQFFQLAIDDTSGKDWPQVTAELIREDGELVLKATVKAAGLTSEETVLVWVQGLNSRAELSDIVAGVGVRQRDVTSEFRDPATDFDSPQLIHVSRLGGDRNGVVDATLQVPVATGIYERVRISAFLDAPITEQQQRRAKEAQGRILELEQKLQGVTSCAEEEEKCSAIGFTSDTRVASKLFSAARLADESLMRAGDTLFRTTFELEDPTELADQAEAILDSSWKAPSDLDAKVDFAWKEAVADALLGAIRKNHQEFESAATAALQIESAETVRNELQVVICRASQIQESITSLADLSTSPPNTSGCLPDRPDDAGEPDSSPDQEPAVTVREECDTEPLASSKSDAISKLILDCLTSLEDHELLHQAIATAKERAMEWQELVAGFNKVHKATDFFPFQSEDLLLKTFAGMHLQNRLEVEKSNLNDITNNFREALKRSQTCDVEEPKSGCVVILLDDLPERPQLALTVDQSAALPRVELTASAAGLSGADALLLILAAGADVTTAEPLMTATVGADSKGTATNTVGLTIPAEARYVCAIAFVHRTAISRVGPLDEPPTLPGVREPIAGDEEDPEATEDITPDGNMMDGENTGSADSSSDGSTIDPGAATDSSAMTLGAATGSGTVCVNPDPSHTFVQFIIPPTPTTTMPPTTTTTMD